MTHAAGRLLVGGMLLGFGGAAGCAGEKGRATVIEFWGMGREGEVVAELVPEFERRNPGIEVQVQQMPWIAAHEKLITSYVGESTPDIAQLGNTWIPEFVALDAILPLDGRIARSPAIDPADYFAGIWQTNVVADSAYGVPWYVDTRALFYRSDLLARAGYEEVPETWEGWLEVLRALKPIVGAGGYPLIMPTNEWPPPVILGLQAGSPLLADGGRYGAFAAPEFRRAFELYIGLFREGLAPPIRDTQVGNIHQRFAAGEYAMYISGPWYLGEFRRRLPEAVQDDWATAPLPGPDGPGVSMAGGSSLVVFKASGNADAAWRFIEYLSSPEAQVRFYELSGNLPARLEAWEAPALAGDAKARAFRQQLERAVPLPRVPEWERIATKVYEYGEAAARGRLTVDQALAALDADVDRMLEKRRWLLARGEER
ncbi:MAG TPA: sugar ABC transporter substrate-binding protein [Gemmatimonadota bacterium]|nr:sugar ABC transporter substrate-binding protein [Gemmatimonadota bacterium]